MLYKTRQMLVVERCSKRVVERDDTTRVHICSMRHGIIKEASLSVGKMVHIQSRAERAISNHDGKMVTDTCNGFRGEENNLCDIT